MSILTYNELVTLVESGAIENVKPEHINGASIDLTLGNTFWWEAAPPDSHRMLDLGRKDRPGMYRSLREQFLLPPNEFVLAQTEQVFHLPDDVAGQYLLTSSLARSGLGHLHAGFADPAWHDSVLTLEFKNELRHHELLLTAGMKCGQMIFFQGSSQVPHDRSYAVRGQYNGDTQAQPSKGVR